MQNQTARANVGTTLVDTGSTPVVSNFALALGSKAIGAGLSRTCKRSPWVSGVHYPADFFDRK
jgi:hypothetical protein